MLKPRVNVSASAVIPERDRRVVCRAFIGLLEFEGLLPRRTNGGNLEESSNCCKWPQALREPLRREEYRKRVFH
jgi:hypothetical protein